MDRKKSLLTKISQIVSRGWCLTHMWDNSKSFSVKRHEMSARNKKKKVPFCSPKFRRKGSKIVIRPESSPRFSKTRSSIRVSAQKIWKEWPISRKSMKHTSRRSQKRAKRSSKGSRCESLRLLDPSTNAFMSLIRKLHSKSVAKRPCFRQALHPRERSKENRQYLDDLQKMHRANKININRESIEAVMTKNLSEKLQAQMDCCLRNALNENLTTHYKS